jgi:hypothetical protein
VALALTGDPEGARRILAALCMHPIAYYAGQLGWRDVPD